MSDYLVVFSKLGEVDHIGIKARLKSFEIRDTFCIQKSTGPSFFTLLRSPLPDTVHESMVKNGQGVIDIDASRVSLDLNDPHMRPNAANHKKSSGGVAMAGEDGGLFSQNHSTDLGRHNSKGRFPTNFILVHDPACKCVGTKKVKPSNGSGTAYQDNKEFANQIYQGGWNPKGVSGTAGFTDSEGNEEVPNWKCESSCPVNSLDTQSRILKSGELKAGHKQGNLRRSMLDSPETLIEKDYGGDEGGASRFFKQFQSDVELNKYLEVLVRGS